MTNSNYDATGILVLNQVTPVIKALFGSFNVDPSYPGNGRAYICRITGSNDPQWPDVREDLMGLSNAIGLKFADSEYTEMGVILEVLARHFGNGQNAELANLVKHYRFEDAADLDTLFFIATLFDDGHGLKEIRFEGCWRCSKPGLFDFGGDGCFPSKEVSVFTDSRQARELGSQLRGALLENQLDFAAAIIAWETRRLIVQVKDESQHQHLLHRVLTHLGDSKA